jgi:hypothetical protein
VHGQACRLQLSQLLVQLLRQEAKAMQHDVCLHSGHSKRHLGRCQLLLVWLLV